MLRSCFNSSVRARLVIAARLGPKFPDLMKRTCVGSSWNFARSQDRKNRGVVVVCLSSLDPAPPLRDTQPEHLVRTLHLENSDRHLCGAFS